MESQKKPNSQSNFEKEQSISFPDFKLYYKAVVIKTVYGISIKNKQRPVEQNREPGSIPKHIWSTNLWQGHHVYTSEGKGSLCNKSFWENRISKYRKMKLDPYLTPLTKINLKLIKDLNLRPDTLKIELPYVPAIPLLAIYPEELKSLSRRDICTSMFTAALFIVAKMWKQSKCH